MRRGMWIICSVWVCPGALARAAGMTGSAHIGSVLGELRPTLRGPWNPGPRAEPGGWWGRAAARLCLSCLSSEVMESKM